MAFSGTVGQATFNLSKVIDHAVRQCGVQPQQITPEVIEAAQGQLTLMTMSWANAGVDLWCIEKQVLPLYAGVSALPLAVGTVDALNSSLRTVTTLTGTETTAPTTHQLTLATAAEVATVGMLWGSDSVPLVIERSQDGVLWDTVAICPASGAAGSWSWCDVADTTAYLIYRVRATSGVLDLDRLVLGATPSEIPLARMNRDDWTSIPNKAFTSGRPLQFWLDRQATQPIMRVWPTPNADAETSQVVVWAQRHLMDVGTMTQEIEVPLRWLDALVSGLAARLLLELPEADFKRQGVLDSRAASALYLAQQGDTDGSPVRLAPDISMYTA